MIQPNELRIGNWVLCKEQPCQLDAYATTVDRIQGVRIGDVWTGFENIKPIWINFDEMDAAGFEENGSHGGPEFEVYGYEKGPVRIFFTSTGVYSVNVFGNQIYYGPNYALHQLQNLYFALTGQELEINL